jgi:hypothetical protein
MTTETKAIEVVELATGRVVTTVDVSRKTDAQIERVERGILINMDTDRFCTRVRGDKEESSHG